MNPRRRRYNRIARRKKRWALLEPTYTASPGPTEIRIMDERATFAWARAT